MLGQLIDVLRDRRRRHTMTDASYWDERTRSRSGFARSVWHSETFSRAWDARQRELLREALGSFRGLRVADVGCGTGRMTRFLASEGARVTGFDFSPATVEVAKQETSEAGLEASFVIADVTSGELPGDEGSFDVALTVGCLAAACKDLDSLYRSLSAMRRVVRPGGHVLLLEGVHTSRLLGRVLRAPLDAWVREAERAGLCFEGVRSMGFLPTRFAFSSVELPSWVVAPAFAAGELALDHLPLIERVSDYRFLRFGRG